MDLSLLPLSPSKGGIVADWPRGSAGTPDAEERAAGAAARERRRHERPHRP
jgi:hypothetical protein